MISSLSVDEFTANLLDGASDPAKMLNMLSLLGDAVFESVCCCGSFNREMSCDFLDHLSSFFNDLSNFRDFPTS